LERFDAVVIGGGPAGSTAAILLARRGWSVLMVESKPFPRRKVCGEFLSATNWPLFRRLSILEPFLEQAGPPVRRTAVFIGGKMAEAPLPRAAESPESEPWGRALAREHLDALLLSRARESGAEVAQPVRCEGIKRRDNEFECTLTAGTADEFRQVRSHVVIAAHGSWEIGELATERDVARPKATDLLAFKAHFRDALLAPGLMPLLSFEDGYGGMTHCDDGRASLSCCIRRSRLAQLSRSNGESAGEAVLQHILGGCPVLKPVLAPALLAGAWLSAGPIQPGIRPRYRDGVFVVGNAAGEAHPVVAEGISMAMQSAWLVCERLVAREPHRLTDAERESIGAKYAADWRRAFAPRIRAAAAIAHWAMRPKLVAATLPLMKLYPSLLTFGARLSGKATVVVDRRNSAATV
jgi:flavin-dependent dehydrogenase